jgi:Icc-related predicted phosphoesterase
MDGFFLNNNKTTTNAMQKIDDTQIQEWKEKYGSVYALPVEDKTAYLREPKMKDFKRAFTAMQNSGDLAFGEEMINLLFIGGDIEIKTDDNYFFPARKEVKEFFNFDEAEITKDKNNSIITIGEAVCKVRIITRDDLKIAEKENPSGKPFVTQEKLFDRICFEKDEAFKDRDNASLRFPLYQAIEKLQNQKVAIIKKL